MKVDFKVAHRCDYTKEPDKWKKRWMLHGGEVKEKKIKLSNVFDYKGKKPEDEKPKKKRRKRKKNIKPKFLR